MQQLKRFRNLFFKMPTPDRRMGEAGRSHVCVEIGKRCAHLIETSERHTACRRGKKAAGESVHSLKRKTMPNKGR